MDIELDEDDIEECFSCQELIDVDDTHYCGGYTFCESCAREEG